MGNQAAVSVSGLRKSYGGQPAVDGVDLEIARGEVLALPGPNGAGKPNLGLRHLLPRPPTTVRA